MPAAHRLAGEGGVSLSQWIAVAVAQKVGAIETAAEFLCKHSEGGSLDGCAQCCIGFPIIRLMSRIAWIDSIVGALGVVAHSLREVFPKI